MTASAGTVESLPRRTANGPAALVALGTALSWGGLFIHNSIELPALTLLSPENSIMALVNGTLFLVWWWLPSRRAGATLLMVVGMVHLVGGGIISVLPLSLLPFVPEQTLSHYLSHLLYGVGQIPLIWAMFSQLRKKP